MYTTARRRKETAISQGNPEANPIPPTHVDRQSGLLAVCNAYDASEHGPGVG